MGKLREELASCYGGDEKTFEKMCGTRKGNIYHCAPVMYLTCRKESQQLDISKNMKLEG